jgi:excisionase family DNA binding protein
VGALPKNPNLLTVTEAAELLRLDYSTVRRWIARGKIKGLRLGGSVIRVDRAEVEAIVAEWDRNTVTHGRGREPVDVRLAKLLAPLSDADRARLRDLLDDEQVSA